MKNKTKIIIIGLLALACSVILNAQTPVAPKIGQANYELTPKQAAAVLSLITSDNPSGVTLALPEGSKLDELMPSLASLTVRKSGDKFIVTVKFQEPSPTPIPVASPTTTHRAADGVNWITDYGNGHITQTLVYVPPATP